MARASNGKGAGDSTSSIRSVSKAGNKGDPVSALAQVQTLFQDQVRRHIETLKHSRGISEGDAVNALLARIAGGTPKASATQVRRMAGKFGIGEEDAYRALVVRDELQRLRKAGMDTLAALREITRRMESKGPMETGVERVDMKTQMPPGGTELQFVSSSERENVQQVLKSKQQAEQVALKPPKLSAKGKQARGSSSNIDSLKRRMRSSQAAGGVVRKGAGKSNDAFADSLESPMSNIVKRLKVFATVGGNANNINGALDTSTCASGSDLEPKNAAVSSSSTRSRKRAGNVDQEAVDPPKRSRRKK